MKTVNFTEMKKGTKEEYLLLDHYEQKYIDETADRILKFMKGLTQTLEGYKITRLEHSLQAATRAYRDKASEDFTTAINPLTLNKTIKSVLPKPFGEE